MFSFRAKFVLEGKPSKNEMNFEIKKTDWDDMRIWSFDPKLPIENESLAKEMIVESLKRMKEINVFGNGFPIQSYHK